MEIMGSFIDLGVLLDTKLNFKEHKALTVNKARSTLGFIKRWKTTETTIRIACQINFEVWVHLMVSSL